MDFKNKIDYPNRAEEVLVIKLKEKGSNGPGSIRYKNTVNFKNPSNLAILFSDLELHGANITKAYDRFKKEKMDNKSFPW